jgi:phosphoheptose isomerase
MSSVQASIDDAVKTIGSLRVLEPSILKAAAAIKKCLLKGGKLLACGNGGSAGDVSDFTTEYTCRFIGDRQPYPAINLTADGALLTAMGNDYGFEQVFARQVRAFGRKGDVLVAVSTSGNSPNILKALEEAGKCGLITIALLGKGGGKAKGKASLDLIVPSKVTARIQEAHKLIFHIICELVDPALKR